MRGFFVIFVVLCMLFATGCGIQQGSVESDENLIKDNVHGLEQQDNESVAIVDNVDTETNAFQDEEETHNYVFPDVIELSFIPVDLVELEEAKEKNSWEFIKSIPLGVMQQKDVTLRLYQDTDSNNLCSSYGKAVLLEYDGKTYGINDCVSDSLLYENLEYNQAVYILPDSFVSDDGHKILHASVELFANGSGRMLYIVYDITNGQWLTFMEWGYPFLVDLDTSGDVELVNQFAGLHSHWPDATIYRWNHSTLEMTNNLKAVLGIDDQNWNEVSLIEIDNVITFLATAVLNQRQQLYETVAYRYIDGKLYKID